MKKLLSLLFLASFLLIISCGKDEDDDPVDNTCDTTDITYTNSIKAIMDSNCALSGCHSAAEANAQGSMADFDSAKTFVGFGRILGALRRESGFVPMPNPPGSAKLNDCLIDKIEAWINAGTPE